MDYFANWQITGVICMALLALSTGNNYLTLTVEPGDQVFSEHFGRNVTFECLAAGNPKPEVLWMRNDVLLAENRKYQITEGGALVINDPARNEHGDRFWCEARNTFGALRSRKATLEIAYVDATSNRQLAPVRANANRGKCLPCHPPDAYPGIQVQWRKQINSEYSNIPLSQRIMTLTDGRLCFAFTGTDGGKYDCSVANSYDNGQRLNFERSIFVTLRMAAAMTNQPLEEIDVPINVTVKRGEEAVLQCIFLGKPLPVLQWTRLGGTIDSGIPTNNYQLRIPNAQPDDSGEYSCTATQGANRQTIVQYLTVISPPILTAELNDTEVSRFSSASFRCGSANPGDAYAWYYNAEPITFDNRVQHKPPNGMSIKSARMNDSGIYQCEVSNRFGAVFSTAQLRIGEPRGSGGSTVRPTPSSSVHTTKHEVPATKDNEHSQEKGPDTKDNEHTQEKGSGGNSSVTLTGSTVLLLIVMMYQKVL